MSNVEMVAQVPTHRTAAPRLDAETAAAAVLNGYQASCVWPAPPVRRIAVLSAGRADHALITAVMDIVSADQMVRWISRDPADLDRRLVDDLPAWWEWADVVVTDAVDESIAEAVRHGFVPAVGMPRQRRSSLVAKRALKTVHPWSAEGLAVQFCLDHPHVGVLDSAAGLRAVARRACAGVMWLHA